MKLFLKGDRCFKDTCAIEKRNFPPGQHGHDRHQKTVGYGLQLREKQKVKKHYGILERQFRKLFAMAEHANFNVFRVWAEVESPRDEFYTLDRQTILVNIKVALAGYVAEKIRLLQQKVS